LGGGGGRAGLGYKFMDRNVDEEGNIWKDISTPCCFVSQLKGKVRRGGSICNQAKCLLAFHRMLLVRVFGSHLGLNTSDPYKKGKPKYLS